MLEGMIGNQRDIEQENKIIDPDPNDWLALVLEN